MVCPTYPARPERNYRVNEFLTPTNFTVKRKARKLKRQNNMLEEIFNFVSRKIEYRRDKSKYGYEEYWTFPEETIENGVGDCEDTSFLLASLLLAANVGTRNVRVVLGRVPRGGHAWVETQTEEGWVLFESTSDSILNRGRNMWKYRTAYDREGYSPELYIYRNNCDRRVRKRLYDRAPIRY